MKYTLGQAAKATGKSKSTISRAIKQGKLSAGHDAHSQYEIDAAELFRVYPMAQPGNGSAENETHHHATGHETPKELIALQVRVEALTEQLERERATIDDLRRRLDVESEERRKLTALLTDNRIQAHPGFWRRLFGGG